MSGEKQAPAPGGEKPPDPLAARVESRALARLEESQAAALASVRFWAGVPIVEVERAQLLAVMRFLRDDPGCSMNHFATCFGTHYPDRAEAPLEMTYCLFSWRHGEQLIVKTSTVEGEPIPTVSEIYPAANWNEREAYDLVGIVFEGHPDMTRILLPDDWVGHPLRKDYPLEGKPGDHKTYR